MHAVDILLSTYNGEKYLIELLDSLERQTFKDFRVLVRDDASQDGTRDILSMYAKESPMSTLLYGDKTNVGVIKSFSYLLQKSQAEYVMFCDQDDVWYPQKIERTLQVAKKFENSMGNKVPLLVHSDLEVVDECLCRISGSMWEHQKIRGRDRTSLKQLLVQNCITGCAMLINRSLVKLVGHLPDGILMHDWYLGLVAAAFGKIIPISEPLIKYRQHSNNYIGSKNYSLNNAIKKGIFQAKRNLTDTYIQAGIFEQQFNRKLDAHHGYLTREYLSIPEKKFLFRRWAFIKNGFWKSGIMRNIGVLLLA